MEFVQIFSIVVFVVALALIISEKVHRALVSIVGAVILMIFVFPQIGIENGEGGFETAIGCIDYNTLGVLFGMMLFVSVVRQSGVFEYLAVKCAKIAKGNPWTIMVLFVILTAVLSALLDNVTTVLLMGPMTLTVCKLLDVNPVQFFMAEILASNIGGTATLIGDPPNIMIGSKAGLTFFDFVAVDTPAVIIILVAFIAILYFIYGRKMHVSQEHKDAVMELNERKEIKSKTLLIQSAVMMAVVVVGFMMHGSLGLESCIIAMGAAGILLLISRRSIEFSLTQVEWTTLTFFAGLFIIVGALEHTGTIELLANALVDVTGGDTFLTMLILLFGSAIISAFLDNIPFVATMCPILLSLAATGMDVTPLWWAVSLGACLGGNGSLIGASANVVMSDIAKKNGYEITFMSFLKTAFPIMVVTIIISAIYLIVRFPPVM